MKRSTVYLAALLPAMLVLPGCTAIGEKAASMSIIYAAAAVLSLLLLIGCFFLVREKKHWFLLLFASVLVVDTGYFCLSASSTLSEALLANRVSYLGSVFLPMSILMIILDTTNTSYKKWLPGLLLGIGIGVFLVAASPGYLDIYYKSVSLIKIDGASVLDKEYGPLHPLYLVYLLSYFASMVAVIVQAHGKKRIDSAVHAAILAVAVLVNIGVWLIEQLVQIEFEMLSISYIISELFLLGLHLVIRENRRLKQLIDQTHTEPPAEPPTEPPILPPEPPAPAVSSPFSEEQIDLFRAGLDRLTPTERLVYDAYIDRKTTKEIMDTLGIKENTLKFHNRNLYGKLGVSSRKQLQALHSHLQQH